METTMQEIHQPTSERYDSAEPITLAESVQSLARFAQTVVARKGLLLATITLAGVAGFLNYSTAPKVYESNAAVWVLQTGSEMTTEISGQAAARSLDRALRKGGTIFP